jgi:hypothetical protein
LTSGIAASSFITPARTSARPAPAISASMQPIQTRLSAIERGLAVATGSARFLAANCLRAAAGFSAFAASGAASEDGVKIAIISVRALPASVSASTAAWRSALVVSLSPVFASGFAAAPARSSGSVAP